MTDPRQALARDVAVAGVQSMPGVAVTAWSLNTVVAALTAIFVLLQIGYLVWKWRGEVVSRIENKAVIANLMQGRIARPGEKGPGDA